MLVLNITIFGSIVLLVVLLDVGIVKIFVFPVI